MRETQAAVADRAWPDTASRTERVSTLRRDAQSLPDRLRLLSVDRDAALWLADLDDALDAAECAALTPEELARAACFVRPQDREHHRVAHWALRHVVAQALGRPIDKLQIASDARGRPFVQGCPAWHISLSHSERFGLVGVSRDAAIGVDIEVLRQVADANELAASLFTPTERDYVRSQPVAELDRAFLAIWTRKEACLKALGLGLAMAPSALDVGPGPGPQTVIVSSDGALRSLEVMSFNDSMPGCCIAWAQDRVQR